MDIERRSFTGSLDWEQCGLGWNRKRDSTTGLTLTSWRRLRPSLESWEFTSSWTCTRMFYGKQVTMKWRRTRIIKFMGMFHYRSQWGQWILGCSKMDQGQNDNARTLVSMAAKGGYFTLNLAFLTIMETWVWKLLGCHQMGMWIFHWRSFARVRPVL